jgi:hypothetical protein
MTFHNAFHPYQWFDLRVETIAHELKLAVGRYETYRPVVLESTQSNALVKFDIFHLHGLASGCSARRLEHDFVVQA